MRTHNVIIMSFYHLRFYYTWSFRADRQQASKAEDNRSFVLLHNLATQQAVMSFILAGHYTVSQKKNVPPLNCLELCQILIDFLNFCTAGKRMKFAIRAI